MRKYFVLLTTLFFVFSNGFAQDSETILTIGEQKISKSEFERIYRKNNSNLQTEKDKKTPAEYMKMFINFKLKVLEAQTLKMDTISSYISELNGYRKELAAPYLTDVQFSDQMVKDMYTRMTKEVHASHILFRLAEDAPLNTVDSVTAIANKTKAEILSGKSFHEAAREISEDPSAKINGGDLGYFTAFQMVTPFEDAVYNGIPGKVTGPVRTAFGLHLILVHEIRDNRGELKVAHIMKMFPREDANFDKSRLKSKIDSIYKALKNGSDFEKMAKEFSDDKQSSEQGGEMPWFSAGRMIPEFAEPAFRLAAKGDISEPIETPYGYHIIKKLDVKPVRSFEELKPEIEESIKRDNTRSVSSKKSFIEKLKKEYSYKENSENLSFLKNLNINTPLSNSDLVIFTIDNKDFYRRQFNTYLETKGVIEGNYPVYLNEWIEHEITNLEDSKLETKYPDFGFLYKEYHDGILLFNISEEKIWNFASQDSAGLQKYYSKNKGKYTFGERFKGLVIQCKDTLTRELADKYLNTDLRISEIKNLINKEEEKITILEGAWEKGNNSIVDYYVWNEPKPTDFDERLTFIMGNKIKPEKKSLSDARGLYISDYQEYIEKNWLKKLHKKYKISVNKKLLGEIKDI